MNFEEQLFENQNLIKSIASKFSSFHDFYDLVQVGTIGFLKAYQKFDPQNGTKLTTYAYKYILGEIRQYVYKDKGIKISREVIRLNNQIEKAKGVLTQQLHREPTTLELSLFLEIEEDTIIDVMTTAFHLASLDESIHDEEKEMNRYDNIDTVQNYDLDELIALKDEIASLKEPERSLMIKRYYEDQSQQETAEFLGISQVQVSRIEAKTLKLLKERVLS